MRLLKPYDEFSQSFQQALEKGDIISRVVVEFILLVLNVNKAVEVLILMEL